MRFFPLAVALHLAFYVIIVSSARTTTTPAPRRSGRKRVSRPHSPSRGTRGEAKVSGGKKKLLPWESAPVSYKCPPKKHSPFHDPDDRPPSSRTRNQLAKADEHCFQTRVAQQAVSRTVGDLRRHIRQQDRSIQENKRQMQSNSRALEAIGRSDEQLYRRLERVGDRRQAPLLKALEENNRKRETLSDQRRSLSSEGMKLNQYQSSSKYRSILQREQMLSSNLAVLDEASAEATICYKDSGKRMRNQIVGDTVSLYCKKFNEKRSKKDRDDDDKGGRSLSVSGRRRVRSKRNAQLLPFMSPRVLSPTAPQVPRVPRPLIYLARFFG